MSNLLEDVHRFCRAHDLLSAEAPVVVGVSGGVDSMVCAHVLRRLGVSIRVAHVNYGLRAAADADAAFVRDWCAAQDPAIPHHSTTVDPERRAEQEGTSVQEAAREQRYAFLASVAEEVEAAAVAVGHHKNDQVETVLLHLLRGTGPEGLAGMRAVRPMAAAPDVPLVRPLLDVSRAAIEAYAEAEGLPWRTDATNATRKYRRNAIRHAVLPQLQEIEPSAVDNVARSARLMREYVDDWMEPERARRLDQAYASREGGGALGLDALRSMPDVWQRRVILDALARDLPDASQTAATAQEIAALIDAPVGRRVTVVGGTVWRGRTHLRLLPTSAVPPRVSGVPVKTGQDVSLPRGTLRLDVLDAPPDDLDTGTPLVVYADATRLPQPLVVRTWTDGDRFRPLGMQGSKSVSDFLTDEQVPPWLRPHVYVLLAGERIAWVVGHRLDDRVRVTPATNQVCRLQFAPRENPVSGSQLL